MKRILLIDGNPLMWRAAYSEGESFVKEGILIYFFNILSTFDLNEVLALWDSGKSRWRSEVYPDYKVQREDRKNEFDLQAIGEGKKEAQEILSHFGVRNISVPGVEADDMLAWFSEYFVNVLGYDQVVIATRDKDLWQLITDKILVFDPMTNTLVTRKEVLEEYDLEPPLIADLKAIMGDKSDNIKGVNGIGEKGAIKFIKKFGTVAEILSLENSRELRKTKTSAKLVEQSDNLELAYKLVKLPDLSNMAQVLSVKDKEVLRSELEKPVVVDHMRANFNIDMLSNSHRIRRRFVSPMTVEVSGILQYLYKTDDNYESLMTLDEVIYQCSGCALCLNSGKVLPVGYLGASYMFIGRAPITTFENEMYKDLLDKLEIPESKVWFTNVCKCSSRLDGPLVYGEVQACLGFLKTEIEFVKPRMIIAFGNEALSAVTEYSSSVSKHIGVIFEGSEGSVGKIESFVAIMPDPLYIKRNPGKIADWEYGQDKIKEFLDKKRGK